MNAYTNAGNSWSVYMYYDKQGWFLLRWITISTKEISSPSDVVVVEAQHEMDLSDQDQKYQQVGLIIY